MDHGSVQQYFRLRIALVVCICLTVAIVLLAVFKDKGWLDVRARAKHLTAVELQIRDMEAENQRLTGEIQALRTDPAAIEKIAREQLKLVKPGEVVLILPEEPKQQEPRPDKK